MKADNIIVARNDKTLYRDGGTCIKVFSSEYSKADVFAEALNQAKIESTKINVPEVYEVKNIDGKWAIVSEYIEGRTLSDMMRSDPENKDKYIDKLIEIQLEIQSEECMQLGRLKDKMNALIINSNLDATTRYDLHSKLEDMPGHHKICHGNLTPSQIIITENGIPYILSWVNSTQGNASADAATTYLHFKIKGDDEGAKKYLEKFCEKSDIARRYVLKWMPIVAAAMSVYCDKKESDMLLSMIDKSDFE